MPAYFSMTLQFENERIKPDFVRRVYSEIISCGYDFKSGFWFHQNANLNEIIEWNQNLLEQGFKLGYTQHVKHDYMQILFASEIYSELRGFWMYSDEEIAFDLIIPEGDILNCEGGNAFVDNKVVPIKELAVKLWEASVVDAIQTSLELDNGYHPLNKVFAGVNIAVNPFAIVKEEVYKKFPEGFFADKLVSSIGNDGILTESNGTTPNYFVEADAVN